MVRIFFINIVSLLLFHFSTFGQTINRSNFLFVKPQPQIVSDNSNNSKFNSTDSFEVRDQKINLRSGQSGLLLKDALNLLPEIYDSKKIDSVINRTVQGGDMSGGGTTLSQNNRRFFLDLYKENISVGLSLCNLNLNNKQIQFLSKFDFETSCLNQTIIQALNRTQIMAPRLHRTLIAIYKNLPFYFSSGKFRILDENFYLDPDKEFDSQMTISTTALTIKDLGIVISLPQFLELSETHQAGLVVHEILRSLQIQFSLALANAEIQEIVAILFSGDEERLFASLKRSGLGDFLELQKEQNPLLKEIFSYYLELINLNPELGQAEVRKIEKLLFSKMTDWQFDLSDTLAHSSREILNYRLKAKQKISPTELIQLERLEYKFDKMMALIRAQGTHGIYIKSLDSVAELTGFLLIYQGLSFTYCADFMVRDQFCASLSQKLKSLID